MLAFLLAFGLVWLAFGLVAFVGDVGLHHVVDATPWLAARPWLIEAGVLAIAGALPVRRRSNGGAWRPVVIRSNASVVGLAPSAAGSPGSGCATASTASGARGR